MSTWKSKQENPYPNNITTEWASGGVEFYKNATTTNAISADAIAAGDVKPTDGQVLVWNDVTKRWEAKDINAQFSVRRDYVGTTNLVYQGLAVPGSQTSDPAWQITKRVYDSSGNMLSIGYAGGSTAYTNVWDNRANLLYS